MCAMGDTQGDSKPWKAHDEVLVARLPARSLCPKNSMMPWARWEVAARRAPVTFADASEPRTPRGYWDPVRTTGLARDDSE